jgi:hypothetical protein
MLDGRKYQMFLERGVKSASRSLNSVFLLEGTREMIDLSCVKLPERIFYSAYFTIVWDV